MSSVDYLNAQFTARVSFFGAYGVVIGLIYDLYPLHGGKVRPLMRIVDIITYAGHIGIIFFHVLDETLKPLIAGTPLAD